MVLGLDGLRRRWRRAVIAQVWNRDPEFRAVTDQLMASVGFAGDGTVIGDRLLMAERRQRRYRGYTMVTAHEAVALIEEVVDPEALGLIKVKDRTWVRDIGGGRFQMLTIAPLKGVSYTIRWGVALPYVPHRWTPRPQFHRTAKSARPDVAGSALELADTTKLGGAGGWIDTFLGTKCVVDDAIVLWTSAQPAASAFWARVETDDGVLDMVRERFDAGQQHSCGLVGALVAARLGQPVEAERFLSSFALPPDEGEQARALVRRYLEESER